MDVMLVLYTVASHVSEVNLDMFFISALNTTDGGGCIEIEFVVHDFTFFGLPVSPREAICYILLCHSLSQGSAGRCCLYTSL